MEKHVSAVPPEAAAPVNVMVIAAAQENKKLHKA